MTRAAKLRAWLAENGPATATQIRVALDLTPRQLKATLHSMVSSGIVVSQGVNRRQSYTVGRTPQREWGKVKPKAERYAYNAKRRRKGDRTQAQIIADAAQRREEAARIKALADSIAKLTKQRQQEGAAQDRRDQSRAEKGRLSDSMAGIPQAGSVVEIWPDSDAFIAANPDKFHRLAPHEVSQPFQRIGFNNQVLGRD